jgi:hypothetical protein
MQTATAQLSAVALKKYNCTLTAATMLQLLVRVSISLSIKLTSFASGTQQTQTTDCQLGIALSMLLRVPKQAGLPLQRWLMQDSSRKLEYPHNSLDVLNPMVSAADIGKQLL